MSFDTILALDTKRHATIIALLDGVILAEQQRWGDDLVQFPTDTHARAAEVMIDGAALVTPPWYADVSVQDARNNLLNAIDGGDQAEIAMACDALLVLVRILSAA